MRSVFHTADWVYVFYPNIVRCNHGRGRKLVPAAYMGLHNLDFF